MYSSYLAQLARFHLQPTWAELKRALSWLKRVSELQITEDQSEAPCLGHCWLDNWKQWNPRAGWSTPHGSGRIQQQWKNAALFTKLCYPASGSQDDSLEVCRIGAQTWSWSEMNHSPLWPTLVKVKAWGELLSMWTTASVSTRGEGGRWLWKLDRSRIIPTAL